MSVNLILQDMVLKSKLKKLRPHKPGETEDMVARLTVNIQHLINHPLWLLFKKSLKEAQVPEDWKIANVTPIFKREIEGYQKKITNL